MNTQLLTSTLGPVELWALTTTAVDVNIRTKLYRSLGPREARRVLARVFPGGSAAKLVEDRLSRLKEQDTMIDAEVSNSIIDQIVKEILDKHSENPDFARLV